jgi:acyl carrier protein
LAEIALQGTRAFATETPVLERASLRDDVMDEVCHQLAPYQPEEKAIGAATVIYQDLSIDSLAVMDIIMDLEDRFDISIPINTVAEIQTVQDLVDAILRLRARR